MPSALLRTNQPRHIYSLGSRTTWWLLGSISLLSCVFIGLMLNLILRLRRSFASEDAAALRLRTITGQLQELVLILDADTLQILDGNDALLRELRCTSAAIRHRTLTDIYPDLDLKSILQPTHPSNRPTEGSILASLKPGGTPALHDL
jgi:hypothetical protein